MKKLRWGLIGCGDIAQKRVAPALRDSPQCDLIAVSRSQSQLLEPFARQFGAKKCYSDWREMLVDPEIDAVYIATPVDLHATQTNEAAEAGKHVLCEKPMGLNVDECDQMIATCRDRSVKLGVAYYRHFYPVIARIKSVIESGEIGHPVFVQINAFEWFNPQPDAPRFWLIKRDVAGGGPMFDFGCHRIEVLLDLFGGARQVKALMANALFEREVEDTAAAMFQFDGGTCAVLTVTHAAREPQDTLEIFGSGGSIHVPKLNEGKLFVTSDRGQRVESHPAAENFHAPLIEDFVAAVWENREPAVTGEIGRSVASIEEQIYETALSDRL